VIKRIVMRMRIREGEDKDSKRVKRTSWMRLQGPILKTFCSNIWSIKLRDKTKKC
jgi:hypothetical protein